jgi:hypothetical protein
VTATGFGAVSQSRTGMESAMLEPSERRRLEEIEQALRTDDPAFAERIDARPRRPSVISRPLYVLMFAGVVMAVCGLFAPVLYAAGLSLTLTALSVALTTSWLHRRSAIPTEPETDPGDEDDPGTGELRV